MTGSVIPVTPQRAARRFCGDVIGNAQLPTGDTDFEQLLLDLKLTFPSSGRIGYIARNLKFVGRRNGVKRIGSKKVVVATRHFWRGGLALLAREQRTCGCE